MKHLIEQEYIHELTATAVVFPDLKNAELQKAYGVLGEAELLKTMLYVGEFAEISSGSSRAFWTGCRYKMRRLKR